MMGDPEVKVDAAALLAKKKAEQAARRKKFKEEFALADTEATTTILKKPIPVEVKPKADQSKAEKPKGDEKKTNGAGPNFTFKDAEEEPGAERKTGDDRPVIDLGPKDDPRLGTVVTSVMDYLARSNAQIFQHAGTLRHPVVEPVLVKGKLVKVNSLLEISKGWLKLELMERLRWARRTREGDGVRYVNPGSEIPQLILDARGKWPFLPASGLISAPTLRPDGSPLQEEGYDKATGLVLINVLKVSINPKPTPADAEAALKTLKSLFVETPFVDGASLSVALSLVISELLRAMLDTTPLHGFVSSTPGSGKSEVVDISHTIATGERCAPIGATKSVDKWERDLAAGIMSGHQLISLDNLTGELSSNLLAQAISQSAISWRPLYLDELIRIPTRSLFVATGNNLTIAGDLDRRTVLARIETGLERPELREFKYNPVQMIIQNRARYINAALTITLAYLAAGMPDLPSDLNGFGQWSRWVRAALMWLGEVDPVLTMQAVRQDDPRLQASAAMLTTMADLLGRRACTAKQMIDATDPGSGAISLKEILDAPIAPGPKQKALREALMGVAGAGKEISAGKLGSWLRGAHDRPICGLVLRGEPDRTRLMHWWVEPVE